MTREEALKILETQLDTLEAGVNSKQCSVRFALAQAVLAANECFAQVVRAQMVERSMSQGLATPLSTKTAEEAPRG